MNATSSSVVVDYQLVSGFNRVRQILHEPQFADRLSKPLAYWALPSDRHLPLAFVSRTVLELIDSPFDELYATPGVGPKKIASLLRLLERVGQDVPPAEVDPSPAASDGRVAKAPLQTVAVSEAHWAQWRQSVAQHGLERETLGQLARSLQHLPRALWSTPLASYLNLSLAEVRGLRAHGEKRVAAVLEVFENLAKILQQLDANPHLSIRFRPRLVQRVESWVLQRLEFPAGPSVEELQAEFIMPLLEQMLVDGGELHCDVVRSRLEYSKLTVRTLARQKGVTRGRLYELWADAATICAVRWPEGQTLTGRLHHKLLAENAEPAAQQVFEAALAIWFPQRGETQQLSIRSGLWHAVAEPTVMQIVP